MIMDVEIRPWKMSGLKVVHFSTSMIIMDEEYTSEN